MRSFEIGRVFGIPIKLAPSFLLVLPLFAWLIGSQVGLWVDLFAVLPGAAFATASLTTGPTPWILGAVAAIGLFVGVLLHELGHSVVALRYGYEIDSIRLWFLGGVAQFTEMPEDWRQEFAVAIAGPLVSVALGVGSYAAFTILPSSGGPIGFVLAYLAAMNIALAGFNMLPAFPLDGGRVLRALLARTRPHAQATELAASVGKAFAVLLGLAGLVSFDVFLVAIALFIYVGAAGEARQVATKAAFEGVTVRNVMTPVESVRAVSPETSVAELLDRMFRERHTGYPVLRNGELVGLVTLDDARDVREIERDAYRVDDVMTTDVRTIGLDADATEALNAMQRHGIGRLPVVDRSGELVGILSRSDLLTALAVIRMGGSPPVANRESIIGSMQPPKETTQR